jgi:hypothetical protein
MKDMCWWGIMEYQMPGRQMQRENSRHCTTIVVKIAEDDGTG